MKKRKPIIKMPQELAERIKRFAELEGISLRQATERLLGLAAGEGPAIFLSCALSERAALCLWIAWELTFSRGMRVYIDRNHGPLHP